MAQRRGRPNPPQAGRYVTDTGEVELVADTARGGWLLLVNGAPSSYFLPGHPEHLEFPYLRWCAAVVEHGASAGQWDIDYLRITHLGGGAASLPCYFAHRYPRSRNTVVEVDGTLARLAREWWDIPRSPSVKIRVDEARAVTESFRPRSRDVIIRDVFSGDATPHSLTTVEFFRHCAQALSPDGIYLANCGANHGLTEARIEIAGMMTAFTHLALIGDSATLHRGRSGNVVLVGSQHPLPSSQEAARGAIGRALSHGGVPARYLTGAWPNRFASGTPPRRDPAEG